MRFVRALLLPFSFLLPGLVATASAQDPPDSANRQEVLRGSVTPERAWWDLLHYHLAVETFPETRSIAGSNTITFRTTAAGEVMQIDLQEPLAITGIRHGEHDLAYEREGSAYWVRFDPPLEAGVEDSIHVTYEGTPVVSKRPPWSGGITWVKDEMGKHFIATSCQGIGSSVWWPSKDHGADEPDRGMKMSFTVPEDLVAVGNGRLTGVDEHSEERTRTFHWEVTQPINSYCVNLNIGNYVNWAEAYEGEFSELDLDYWVLEHQLDVAQKQFKETPRTIEAFEHWFGKYPFYEDSFKLVVVPYLGMEHQSSVTYGNGFQNGYRGTDLSATGVGMKFDFIIVHEAGHEWWGNNVSMKDVADMWIHESFTNYSENLFVEYHFSEKEAQDYVIGCRRLISNDAPIIGTYGVNRRGSGDMYYKGGNLLHTLRHVLDDDAKWREILRGIQSEFWHQTVTTAQVESYISEQTGIDLGKFFDQYLRTTDIPKLVYRVDDRRLHYRFENVVAGFAYPVEVRINGKALRLTPTEEPQIFVHANEIDSFELDRNFYMTTQDESPASRR